MKRIIRSSTQIFANKSEDEIDAFLENQVAYNAMLEFKNNVQEMAEAEMGEVYGGDCTVEDYCGIIDSVYRLYCSANIECEDGWYSATGTISIDLDSGRIFNCVVKPE